MSSLNEGNRRLAHRVAQAKYISANKERVRTNTATWREANRLRIRKRQQEWRENNPDKTRAIAFRWSHSTRGKTVNSRAKVKRRGLLAVARCDFTGEQWEAMKRRAGGRCYYCHRRLPLEMDHVIPLVEGGNHTESNIVPACRSCNASKGKKLVLLC
jgi:5-methylcytosine-specific restriction endonuclease McrA